MFRVRGIRGATTSDSNTVDDMTEATSQLLKELVRRNGIDADDVAAALFSTTSDLSSMYPASVARLQLGWVHVALMDVQQVEVRGGVPLCIRVLLLVNTTRSSQELENVYMNGAVGLRDGDHF